MQIQKFQRKPFTVEGVKVTEENIDEVAVWCLGEVQTNPKTKKKHIRVDAHRPLTERQTMAIPGDWVLFHNRGFKVYTESAFTRNFELVEVDSHSDHGEFVPTEEEITAPIDFTKIAEEVKNASVGFAEAVAKMKKATKSE